MENKLKNINVKNIGNFLQENKKPLLYIGGTIAVVSIGLFVVKNLKGGISSFFNPGKNTIGANFINQDIDKSKLSISEATAKNYAEALFEAFNYRFGTDKSVISNVFSKINSEDYKLIHNLFGVRTYSNLNGGSPSEKWWSPDTWTGSRDISLEGWIVAELDISDYLLKQKIKKIIEPAGFSIG